MKDCESVTPAVLASTASRRNVPSYLLPVSLGLAMLLVTGCSLTGASNVPGNNAAKFETCKSLTTDGGKKENVTDQSGAAHPDLITSLMRGLTTDPAAPDANGGKPIQNSFDKLLDCYVGPVAARDIEKRLFRGHVIVAMLAKYGHYNLTLKRYPGLEDDAGTILKSISATELALSRSSPLLYQAAGAKDSLPDTPLDSYMRVDRVMSVLQVAIDVERPTFNRGKEAVLNLIAAIGGSPAALRDLLGDGLAGLRKAAVLEVYGSALRVDAYNYLDQLKNRDVTVDDWEKWDAVLFRACQSIAEIARTDNTCVPSSAALLASVAGGQPRRR